MNKSFVFVHIEKTSATSIRRSVIEPNVMCHSVGSLRKSMIGRQPGRSVECCYHGHVAYGFHRALQIDPVYVTMLRSPLERAVSFYYFVKDLQQTDLFERHRLRNYADSVTIAEFFENWRFSNAQTRRLAGMEFDRVYPHMHGNRSFMRAMLAAAKRHLDAMPVFGLQEEFEESQRRFLQFVGGSECVHGLREKATHHRRTLEEITEVSPTTIDRLTRAHLLDLELVEHARERFAAMGPPPPARDVRMPSRS